MSRRQHLSSWTALIVGGIVGLLGWVLIIRLLREWPVSAVHDLRLLFFTGLWLAVSGTALPLIWLLHRRFGQPAAGETWNSFGVLARQAVWVGTWVVACAWLQMHEVLNWAMALLLVVVLALVEALLRIREEAEQEL